MSLSALVLACAAGPGGAAPDDGASESGLELGGEAAGFVAISEMSLEAGRRSVLVLSGAG